jgi:hypothetical protein
VAHTLSFDRLVSTYLVPQDHPAPDQVRRDLDEVVRKYIADSCGRALAPLLDPRDASVWLIDRVAIDLVMDFKAAAPETAAQFWAGKLAESVARTIAHGADGDRIMRFANRAEFLAYFLRDLADGAAWGKWYYRQFETLRSLPASPAIREALFREPDQAEATLLCLARTNRIGVVANALSQADQERLVRLCCPEESTPQEKVFEAVLQTLRTADGCLRRPLDLYLMARHEHPEFPAAEVRSGICHALTVARWQQSSQLDGILADVAHKRLSRVFERVTPGEQQTVLYLSYLTGEDPGWSSRIAEIVYASLARPRTGDTPDGNHQENGRHFASPWSGVFLLLPTLIAHRELMAAYGGVENGDLRYLLLAACLGASSGDWRFDQSLAIAAGFESTPEPRLLQMARPEKTFAIPDPDLLPEDFKLIATQDSWWPEIPLESTVRRDLALSCAVLLRSFAHRLPGLGQSSFGYLWRNILSGDAVITVSPGNILVELSPRPLAIVLGMAGLREAHFTPPWMPETNVVLRCDRQ